MDKAALLLLATTLATAGCAARPVAYSGYGTAHREQLGRAIDECTELAQYHVRSDPGMGRSVARAAGDVLAGAIRSYSDLGGAARAAANAGDQLAGSLNGAAQQQDALERRYVEYCLFDRGYDVIGWR